MNVRLFAVLAACSAAFLFDSSALAQVPGVINYQGRVVVGTTNFNGTGQFRFALTNSNGSIYYWVNDGSAVGPPGQPTNAVSLTVTNGLYSVLLGDTTPPLKMTAIPASVFTNPDVRLRVWFDDGVPAHGIQRLSPDQRLAAAGYAFMAGGVNLPATTSATNGVLMLGGQPFLHAYGNNSNVFLGNNAGNFSMTGGANTATGAQALLADTSGANNTANGNAALGFNTTGSNNTGLGSLALGTNTTGADNTAVGANALSSNSDAGQNVAVGSGTLQNQSFNNSGTVWNSDNTAVGFQALYANQPTNSNSSGVNNTALGAFALTANTTGRGNDGIGVSALQSNTTGRQNVADGVGALLRTLSATRTWLSAIRRVLISPVAATTST